GRPESGADRPPRRRPALPARRGAGRAAAGAAGGGRAGSHATRAAGAGHRRAGAGPGDEHPGRDGRRRRRRPARAARARRGGAPAGDAAARARPAHPGPAPLPARHGWCDHEQRDRDRPGGGQCGRRARVHPRAARPSGLRLRRLPRRRRRDAAAARRRHAARPVARRPGGAGRADHEAGPADRRPTRIGRRGGPPHRRFRPECPAGGVPRGAPAGHRHRRRCAGADPTGRLARPAAARVLVGVPRREDRSMSKPAAGWPKRPAPLAPGVRLTIRGRTVRLRGLRRAPSGPLWLLTILGPGLVAANAGNDAGGIATYAQVGAKYGYDLLWMLVLITFSLAIVQEMAARLGVATGRGLLDLVRERFGIAWTLFAVGVVLVANGGVTISEFLGIAAALELFGITRLVSVPVAGLAVWWRVTRGSYKRVEKVFLVMTLVFFAYPVAAILAGPDWGAVARHAVVPTVRLDPEYLLLFVATVGTTITPYMQLFQQSAAVEAGVARAHYSTERWDAYLGALFSNVVAAFIVIASAATLHVVGQTEVETAAEAAQALAPVAGPYAQMLF